MRWYGGLGRNNWAGEGGSGGFCNGLLDGFNYNVGFGRLGVLGAHAASDIKWYHSSVLKAMANEVNCAIICPPRASAGELEAGNA